MITVNTNKDIDVDFGFISPVYEDVLKVVVLRKKPWVFYILMPLIYDDEDGEMRNLAIVDICESVLNDGDSFKVYEMNNKNYKEYINRSPFIALDVDNISFVWLHPPKSWMV